MHVLLARVRLVQLGPFDDITFTFGDADAPRRVRVVTGGAGVGKTSLLSAIASTRPGHVVAQLVGRGESGLPGFAVADYWLGDDDQERPRLMRLASPNAKLDEPEDLAALRRREQAALDRRAADAGFVFVAFSGARWFSRTPTILSSPDRTVLRYDVRVASVFDDASRADLTRETKQAIVFANVGAALLHAPWRSATREAERGQEGAKDRAEIADRLGTLRDAMDGAIGAALAGTGFTFEGVDPLRLEPMFSERGGAPCPFDDLPRGVRHVLSFVVLGVRALGAAYPLAHPRTSEAVVIIDDADAQLPIAQQRTLVPRLRAALPRVQWILTTASLAVADGCEAGDLCALHRMPESGAIELYDGRFAVVH